MQLQVFRHALYVADIGDTDLYHAVVGLDKDGRLSLGPDSGGTLLFYPVRRPHKVLQAEGLQQVVNGIDLEALDSIFGVGGGKYDEGRGSQRLDELHAIEVGHVDVAENDVDGLTVEHVDGLEGTLALGCQLKEWHLINIGDELLQGQRLVVDGDDSYHVMGMLSSTV